MTPIIRDKSLHRLLTRIFQLTVYSLYKDKEILCVQQILLVSWMEMFQIGTLFTNGYRLAVKTQLESSYKS